MASNIKTNNDIKEIVEWAKKMKERGMYVASTTAKRIKSLQNICSILGKDEAKDPVSLLKALDDITDRWARKTIQTPISLRTTKSHAKGLLSDYIDYKKDTSGFKPHSRRKKPKVTAAEKKETKVEHKETTELKYPSLNINIQIHISAETSEKQIDKIFESMARYIPFKKT